MGSIALNSQNPVLRGIVTKVIYQKESTYSYILLAKVDNQLMKLIGPSNESIKIGDQIQAQNPRKHVSEKGIQYYVDAISKADQTTPERSSQFITPEFMSASQMINFLSENVEGVGDVLANRIVAHFGKKTHRILTYQPEMLLEMEGIGKYLQSKISASYQHECKSYDISGILKTQSLSASVIQEIVNRFGTSTLTILRSNPFYFLNRVRDITFKECDALATGIGMNVYSYRRVNAAILHSIQTQTERFGHTLFSNETIISQAAKLLGFSSEAQKQKIIASMEYLQKSGDIVARDPGNTCSMKSFAKDEKSIAENIARIVNLTDSGIGIDDPELGINSLFGAGLGIACLPAGYKKLGLYENLNRYAQRSKKSIVFCTLSKKSSLELKELTGLDWKTIHALLKYKPAQSSEISDSRHDWGVDDKNPLQVDILVINEFHNVDITLAAALFSAIPTGAELFLIGEQNQLPSVGPGQVFRDLLEFGKLPIWKPGISSAAPISVNLVDAIKSLNLDNQVYEDGLAVRHINVDNDSAITPSLIMAVEELVATVPFCDIQILSCKYKGENGVDEINSRMQKLLGTSSGSVVRVDGQDWFEGDRVVNTKRLPELAMSKGSIGTIKRIDKADKRIFIAIDEVEISCSFKDAPDCFKLAYCMTPYMAQSSTFKCVVMALPEKDSFMLNRSMLCSVISKTSLNAVLVGQERILKQSAEKELPKRRTGLIRELDRCFEF